MLHFLAAAVGLAMLAGLSSIKPIPPRSNLLKFVKAQDRFVSVPYPPALEPRLVKTISYKKPIQVAAPAKKKRAKKVRHARR